jgi:hypothetical protein
MNSGVWKPLVQRICTGCGEKLKPIRPSIQYERPGAKRTGKIPAPLCRECAESAEKKKKKGAK